MDFTCACVRMHAYVCVWTLGWMGACVDACIHVRVHGCLFVCLFLCTDTQTNKRITKFKCVMGKSLN